MYLKQIVHHNVFKTLRNNIICRLKSQSISETRLTASFDKCAPFPYQTIQRRVQNP